MNELPSPSAAAGTGPDADLAYEHARAVLEQMASLTRSAGSTFPAPPGLPASAEPEPAPAPPGSAHPWKAELRYRALVEKIPAVTFMAGFDDTVHDLYVSPQIEAMLGFSQKEWLEDPFLWYSRLHPEDRDRWGAEFARTCATGVNFRSEYRLLARDGRVVWVRGECQVIRDDEGRPVFLQGIAFDITESKHAEATLRRAHLETEARVEQRTAELAKANEELRAAKEEVEAASKAKDHFLAVLSHELRTPLTPVLASVEVLARHQDLPEEVVTSLDTIRRNVAMEAHIIDDLLDLTRISRGKVELHLTALDAHACLRHALEVCQRTIEAKRIEVTQDLAAAAHHVRADPTRLQQVFWNLIGNAAKFTPEGGRITLRSSNDAQGGLTVQVADNGIGISEDLLPRMFSAFEQGERTVTRRYGGLGLGLAISKALVEMHQGTLVASSEGPGRGATFTVSLGTIPEPAPVPLASAPPPSDASRNGLRLLLVDDHQDTLWVMARLLTLSGYRVKTAGSVQDAVRLADSEPFDLLISDLGLPDGSGHDLMRQVKAKHGLRGIALSGFGMDDDVQRSMEAGFERHLTKPVSLELLRATIREVRP